MCVATQTENLIQALQIEVTILKEQVEALRSETKSLPEITKQIAVIEHQLSELTKTKELWGQRES
jgi:predicted  nucleic acid-binding Zn-ribbon protein